MNSKILKDSLVVGLALFAMFFGAGNVIFPPYIGVISGGSWLLGFMAYFFADIGLAVLAYIALICSGNIDRFESIMYRLGPWPSRLTAGGIIFAIAFIATPRTATVSYDLGIVPTFGDVSLMAYSIAYFAICWFFCIKESKVVDYIGKYLTPALVIGLVAMIIIGIASPLGEVSDTPKIDNVWYMGLISGYQTMDALAVVTTGILVSIALTGKGYATPESKTKAVLAAASVTAVLMFIVYGGLCYLGATVSGQYGADVQHGPLVVAICQGLLGKAGAGLLGLVVVLACLTTGVALCSVLGSFLNRVTEGRLKYNVVVTLACFAFAMISNLGLARILAIAVPVIIVLYPALLVMVCLSLFDDKIENSNIFKVSVGFAVIYSVLEVIRSHGVEAVDIIEVLPLQEHGFGWILPAVFGAVVGYFVKPKPEGEVAPAGR